MRDLIFHVTHLHNDYNCFVKKLQKKTKKTKIKGATLILLWRRGRVTSADTR